MREALWSVAFQAAREGDVMGSAKH